MELLAEAAAAAPVTKVPLSIALAAACICFCVVGSASQDSKAVRTLLSVIRIALGLPIEELREAYREVGGGPS